MTDYWAVTGRHPCFDYCFGGTGLLPGVEPLTITADEHLPNLGVWCGLVQHKVAVTILNK